jgi:tetratricopeptide (TPR) repeat protein
MQRLVVKFLMAIMVTMTCISFADAATALELRKQGDILREEGQSLKAIDTYNHAIVHFQEDKDYSNMMEALTGRLLSWKHLFYKTNDKVYAIFVMKEAEEMLEIAKEHRLYDKLFLIHYLNGTAAILLKDYSVAEKEFKLSVESYPFDNAEKGDWIAHLGDAMYLNGKKEEGKKLILQGIQKIQDNASQIDSFYFNVWVSGAYLRLAKLLRTDNQEESQMYFLKAKKMIDSDDRLVIRKQQLEAYIKEMK